jgi:hypothetical protein
MKSKKPLLGVAFVAILLAVMMIVPAAASAAPGSGGGKPVNSASFVGDSNNDPNAALPGFRSMDAIHVQALDGVVLNGKYLDQFTGKPGVYEYRFSSRDFTSEWWDTFMGSGNSLSHAWFGPAADYPATLWPTYWLTGGLPSEWDAFDANVADFVVYVPRDQVPQAWDPETLLPEYADSLPVRYVLLDFGEGRSAGKDLYEAWICYKGLWVTESDVLTPVPNGNIQVHVAAADFGSF